MLAAKGVPVYCVGWIGEPVLVNDSLWQPSPPKSYKSPEAKQGWIEDLKADTAVLPYVGEAADLYVLDQTGHAVFTQLDPKRFMQWADLQAGFTAMEALDSTEKLKAMFVGFNVKQLFLSIAAQLWAGGVAVPFRFWHGTPGLFDINDMLIPGALRNGFDAGSLLAFGANEYLPAEYISRFSGAGQAVMRTAEEKAIVTLALAKFAQLI